MRLLALAALSLLVLAMPGVGLGMPLNDIQLAQASRFHFDSTLTVKEALDRYSLFSRVTWQVMYDEKNRKVVEARGYFDMAKIATRTDSSTCVNTQGVYVGLTDDGPFYILQFRPDFLKQKAAIIYSGVWGLHGGGRLADPDMLWAKALVTDELPSPTPLCAMPLAELSPADKLAIQEAPVTDPDADKPVAPPREAPDPAKTPAPPAKSAVEATKKSQETPPTPTTTGR